LAPPGSINLGFFLRENLLLCASYLPLGVPNERVSYTPSSSFSGAVAVELKKSYTIKISYSHVNYTPAERSRWLIAVTPRIKMVG
jgi:hypothetical protein